MRVITWCVPESFTRTPKDQRTRDHDRRIPQRPRILSDQLNPKMDPYYPWLIKQHRLTRLPKLLQPHIPRTHNLSRTFPTLHARERVGIHDEPQVTINLPIVRIELPQR